RREDGSEVPVTVTDLSDEGCRVECAEPVLRIGEWIEVNVPSEGELKAQVRWALGGSAGVKFEREANS
ncbi:MAG TPA: PilZ domain-containing protein, partial [Sphingomicrobium sp.]|nr:PilZ domain-containing protein [Sphingomicrobium sp.]